jgi:ATP-binding cassette subfamily B protein
VLCVVAVIAALLESALLYLIARLATSLSTGVGDVDLSVGPLSFGSRSSNEVLVLATVLLAVVFSLSWPMARLSAVLSEHALTDVRTRLLSAYLSSLSAHRSAEAEGHLQTLIGENAQRAERVVQQLSMIVVAATGTFIMTGAALFVAPVPTICGAAAFVVVMLVLRPMSQRVKLTAAEFADLNKVLLSRVAQTARVGQEIASFEVEQEVASQLGNDVAAGSRLLRHVRLTSRLTPMLYQYCALGLVLAAIGALIGLSAADVTYMGPLILLMIRALGYAKQMQTAIQNGIEYVPYVADVERNIESLTSRARLRGTATPSRIGAVSFVGVSFSYSPGAPVLTGIDLRIDHGDAIGIIGPSGAGKTTLLELLMRLQVPTHGHILADDISLTDISPERWSDLVAFVPQDNKLIRASVADNIRFYRAVKTQAEVESAARRAHLHDEIISLPAGYETLIGPGERSISGGQRQRLGIARALLGEPDVLVLDEPTSALDQQSEALVKESLMELVGLATLIVVAHRPATLELCDRVLRVADGRVHEVQLERFHDGGPRAL